MRATPSLRRLASTMTRPPSSCVICAVSRRLPSAMPTRSAPSSRALPLISAAVSGLRNISKLLLLLALEFLELTGNHALVALGPDPARVPLRQAAAWFTRLARLLPLLLRRGFLRRALGDHLLHLGENRDAEAVAAGAQGG